MKRLLIVVLALFFLLSSFAVASVNYNGVDLEATLASSANKDVALSSTPSNGTMVVVRLKTVSGKIEVQDILDLVESVALRDSRDVEYPAYGCRINGAFIAKGDSTSVSDGQSTFDLFFFMEGNTGDVFESATVLIPLDNGWRTMIPLDSVSHGEPTPTPVPEVTKAPKSSGNGGAAQSQSSAPAAAAKKSDPFDFDAATINAALTAINDPTYSTMRSNLSYGTTIGKGSSKEDSKALQTILVGMGRNISVDGSIGNKTITALHEVQKIVGLPESDTLNAECFDRIILCMYCMKDESAAIKAIGPGIGEYMAACANLANGNGYHAKQLFDEASSAIPSAADRVPECAMAKPKKGELYHNKSYSGRSCTLKINAKNLPEGRSALFKVYTTSGELVSAMFISDRSTVQTKLPAGDYVLKIGSGTTWYGLGDAFGEGGRTNGDAFYTVAYFSTSDTITLKKNYIMTATINPVSMSEETIYSSLPLKDF